MLPGGSRQSTDFPKGKAADEMKGNADADSAPQGFRENNGTEDGASSKRNKNSPELKEEAENGPGPSGLMVPQVAKKEEASGIEELNRALLEENNQLKLRNELLASENEVLRKELKARREFMKEIREAVDLYEKERQRIEEERREALNNLIRS